MRRVVSLLVSVGFVGCVDYDPRPISPPHPELSVPPAEVNLVQLDRFVQVTQPAVDVLFVVDNSCSMAEEQAALAQNFPAFMAYFENSGVDYHIGVTSTDMASNGPGHEGRLRAAAGHRFISLETPDPELVFAQMTNLGIDGDATEQGRAAAYTAIETLRDAPSNDRFVRDEASMHLIFVSDEEDQSGANPVTRNEFIGWMRALKWAPELTVAHGIYWIPETSCPNGESVGTAYHHYVNQTGGTKQSLCAPNWGPFLDELGLQTSGLKREFFLTQVPQLQPWSLRVAVATTVDEQTTTRFFGTCRAGDELVDPDCEVVYLPSRNSIRFLEFVPPPQAEILVSYTLLDGFTAVE